MKPIGVVLFFVLISEITSFAKTDDNDSESTLTQPSEEQCDPSRPCRHWRFWKDREEDLTSFAIGMQWVMPLGDLYDRWNAGFGFDLRFGVWVSQNLSLQLAFHHLDLSPNASSQGVSTDGWDTNILHVGLHPKYYLWHDRISLGGGGGWYGIRRDIPNFSSLNATQQAELKDENNLGVSGEIEVYVIKHFLSWSVGTTYIFDEGQSILVGLLFHFI